MPANDPNAHFRPSDEMLLDYVTAALDGPAADRVAAAVQADSALSERVARMQLVLATLNADDSVQATGEAIRRGLMVWAHLGARPATKRVSWPARAQRCIADLVFDSRSPLALSGYRSAGASATPDADGDYQLAYASPAGRVDLHISASPDDHWRLRGQVASAEPVEVGTVALLPIDGGQELDAVADTYGQFCFDTISGRYDLLIELDHGLRAILAADLEIGGT